MKNIYRCSLLTILFLVAGMSVFAVDRIYPDKPVPPRLVNDFAGMLQPAEAAQLESKLNEFAKTTSNQITVVTIRNLGGHDVEEYSVEVFNQWGIGEQGKNNGVLLLVAADDHKAWITVGKGLEGVLTDAQAGLIFRNELRPAFKEGKYYQGLSDACDAIVAVTKGAYKPDGLHASDNKGPATMIIIIVIIIVIIIRIMGGGGGGGNYMSRRGFSWGNFATGMILGNLLGGGRGESGWGGNGGGGFGGFGGGSTGGGGAGGSW